MADKDPKNALGSDLKAGIANLKSFTGATQAQNDGLKESINLLKDMQKSYDRIADRVSAMNKATINTNKLEKELEKTKQQQNRAVRDLAEYQRQQANTVKMFNKDLNAELLLQQKINNKELEGSQLKKANKYLKGLQNDLEYQSYKTSIMAVNKAKEEVELMQEKVEEEKKIAEKVGFTGNLLKLSNKYLGIGGGLYAKIVEEAREGEVKTKGMVIAAAAFSTALYGGFKAMAGGVNTANKAVSGLTGTGGPISKLVSPFTDLISKIPLIGGLLGGVVDMLANVADYATDASSAIQKFGRNLGYSAEEATKINNYFSGIAHSSGDLLYNSRKIRESATELYDALGITKGLSDQIVLSNIKLKELGELDLETRKELAIVTLNTGQDQDAIARTLYGQTKSIEKTLGVSFKWQQILKEASSLSGYLGLSFTKYPEKLQKSLMIVKATGLEMKQLDNIANSLLDYESSIASEFEAQLMTGKNINLSKARELFLNNQLAEAAQEITKQVGTSEEFLQLNRFGAEALAKSFGMSRDELGNMLKQQELFARVGATDLKTYQQRLVTMNATIEGQKQLVELIGEQEYSNFMNQTATEKIANFIDKIKQSFADLLNNSSFKGFIDKILDFISSPEQIDSMIQKLTGFVSLMIRAVAEIINGLDYVVRVSTLGFGDIDNSIIDKLMSASTAVGGMNMGIMTNSPAPTTVGGAVIKGATTPSSTPSNQMGMGTQRDRGGDIIYISNTIDPITPGKVVTLLSNSPAPNQDYSPIANKK
jgi:hypothetical protein